MDSRRWWCPTWSGRRVLSTRLYASSKLFPSISRARAEEARFLDCRVQQEQCRFAMRRSQLIHAVCGSKLFDWTSKVQSKIPMWKQEGRGSPQALGRSFLWTTPDFQGGAQLCPTLASPFGRPLLGQLVQLSESQLLPKSARSRTGIHMQITDGGRPQAAAAVVFSRATGHRLRYIITLDSLCSGQLEVCARVF